MSKSPFAESSAIISPLTSSILEGMLFFERTEVQYSRCGAHLEGTDVELGAPNVDAARWHVVTVYDVDCGPDSVPERHSTTRYSRRRGWGCLQASSIKATRPPYSTSKSSSTGTGADCRIESERSHRPTIRYRRSRADVRDCIRSGCWQRLAYWRTVFAVSLSNHGQNCR